MVCIIIIFWNELLVLRRRALESQATAQTISLVSISWNTMWTLWLLYIHTAYLLNDHDYIWFIVPTLGYLVMWAGFQMPLMHTWWRARYTSELATSDEVNGQIAFFFLKFYVVFLISLSLSDCMFRRSWVLDLSNGLIWLPQIIENIHNNSRDGPYAFFCIFGSIHQSIMPLYFLLHKVNIFEIRKDQDSVWVLSILHSLSILVLFWQHNFGARFLFPKSWRENK